MDYTNVNIEGKTYSAGYPTITGSIQHAKRNILTLDNISNWYLFEDQVLMGMPILNKYRNVLMGMTMEVNVPKELYYKPEYVSARLYGTTDLWYLLLYLNNMKNQNEFNKPIIKILKPSKINDYIKILSNESSNLYKMDNPKHIYKHYLKHPSLPSDKILPDNFDEEIDRTGVKNFTYEDFYWTAKSNMSQFYFKGKSKMNVYKRIDDIFIDNNEHYYMDGIRIHNENSGAVLVDPYKGYERKFTGYINLSKPGEYKFQINGINGEAYLIINNNPLYDENTRNSMLELSNIKREYDYFERRYRNSDFKQRNTNGWNELPSDSSTTPDVIKKEFGKLIMCKKLKKPVLRINSDTYYNYFTSDIETNKRYEVITNRLFDTELNKKLEPHGNDLDSEIMFSVKLKTENIKNFKLLPFIKCWYVNPNEYSTDYTIEYGYEEEWKNLLNTKDYVDLFVVASNLEARNIKAVDFGIIIEPLTKIKTDIDGIIDISSMSIHKVSNNILVNKNINDLNKWVPFIASYKHNGLGSSMFNITWKEPDNDKFVSIPEDCVAIIPDVSDENILSESIMILCEKDYETYMEFATSKFDKIIFPEKGHRKISYYTNIKYEENVKYRLLDLYKANTDDNFHLYINNKELVNYIPELANPEDYLLLNEGDSISKGFILSDYDEDKKGYILFELIKETNYEELEQEEDKDELVNPIMSNEKNGYIIQFKFEKFNEEFSSWEKLTDKDVFIDAEVGIEIQDNSEDPILQQNGTFKFVKAYDIEIFKNSLIEFGDLSGYTENSDCFMLQFDITVLSPDYGQVFINLDNKIENGTGYKLIINTEPDTSSYIANDEYNPSPIFNYENGLYVYHKNYYSSLLSNIDNGIDFYKSNLRKATLYSNNITTADDPNYEIWKDYNLDNFRLVTGKTETIFIRKNNNIVVLGVIKDDIHKIIASWLDDGDDYKNWMFGSNSISLFNIRKLKISNITLAN